MSYVVLLFSLSVHESAHAWTAFRQGDPTARSLGRISLNPLVHVDVIGTVVMPLLMIFTGVPLLGWAKPTPVDPRYFRDLRRGQIVVSGAGPVSNLLLAHPVHGRSLRRRPGPGGAPPGEPAGHPAEPRPAAQRAPRPLQPRPAASRSTAPTSWSGALPNGIGHRYVAAVAPYGGLILLALVMSGGLWTVLGPVQEAVLLFLYSLVR